MIAGFQGSDCGVPRNDNHMLVEWADDDSRVVFSYCQHGEALSAHFACGPESLRQVKPAIHEFVKWAFWAYPWSKMIFANVDKPSVERVIKKCGFDYLCTVPEGKVYSINRFEVH